jgi:antibiotic biosynthesis monooxygenase (ABM) superfamily enzyme
VAWVVVVALLSVLGHQLGQLPLALRALAISGVLVALMANLVMPLLGQAAERWLTRRALSGWRSGERGSPAPGDARDRGR